MRLAGLLPPQRTPNCSDLYVVVGLSALTTSWSIDALVFQPYVQPPEQSERLNVPSSASVEPVHSSDGPFVCGAPTPLSGMPRPAMTLMRPLWRSSGARMGPSVNAVSAPVGFHLSHTVPCGVKKRTRRFGDVAACPRATRASRSGTNGAAAA